MSFDGTEGKFIDIATGGAMTAKYRANNPGTTIAHFLGKDKLMELLNQDNCKGLRIYHAIDNNGKPQIVVVGALANENDITDKILDMSLCCPSYCSQPNGLNS